MRTNRQRIIAPALAIIAALATAASTAEAAPRITQCFGEEGLLTVKGDSAAYAVNMMRTGDVSLRVPRGIRSVQVETDGLLDYRRDEDKKFTTIRLFFRRGARVGDTSSARVESFGFRLQLHVTAVDDVTKAVGDLRAMPIDDMQHEAAKVAALVETQVAKATEQQETQREQRERAMWEQGRADAEEAEARQRLRRYKVYPDEDQAHEQAGPVFAHFLEADWENGQHYVYFKTENSAMQPQAIKALTILDAQDQPITEARVYFDERAEVQTASADDAAEPSAKELAQKESLQRIIASGARRVDALVDGQQSATGVIVIPAAAQRGQHPLGLRVYGLGGQLLAETILKGWKMRPVTQSEWERDQRAKAAKGRISVGVQPIYGAMWLTSPVAPENIEAASIVGLSMRVGYGVNHLFSIEGEIAGASTGNARYRSATWNAMQGELTRNVALGRLLLVGAIHIGHKYRPFARVGIGLQGASHDARFTPNGGSEMAGPDTLFEIGGVWYFGVGMDARLNEHWRLGLSFSGVGVATRFSGDGITGSLQGGLYLGYGWKPETPDL